MKRAKYFWSASGFLIGRLVALFATMLMVTLEQASAQTSVQNYVIVDLGTLRGLNNCEAHAINNRGDVVGSESLSYAFLYSGGRMVDLASLTGTDFWSANGINDNGQIVGYGTWNGSRSNGDLRAFSYSSGALQVLGTLGGVGVGTSVAAAINNQGQFVGQSDTTNAYHAFLYSNGVMLDIGALIGDFNSVGLGINNYGDVVGWSDGGSFLYSNGMIKNLGAFGMDEPVAINDRRQVVGYSYIGGVAHGLVFENGSISDLGSNNIPAAINSSGVIVGHMQNQLNHAFVYCNGSIHDLNDLIVNPELGWTVAWAAGVNDAGQICGSGPNVSGEYHALLLNPLVPGALQACINPQPQPTYGDCPARESDKDSLIFVTHGTINPLDTPEASTVWISDISNSITQYLLARHSNNWQIATHTWIDKATITLDGFQGPQKVLNNAIQEGMALGACLSTQAWSHVHLIAHSAGSGLIQAISETIKSKSANTAVHCTFLDAFVGEDYAGITNYGSGADWSDSYFSRDLETGGDAFPYTQGIFDHAYNVEVTWIDQHKTPGAKYISTPTGVQLCTQTVSSHGWPVTFYGNTVPPNVVSNSQGFGFLLSKEGGNWDYATNHYTVGREMLNVLGTPDDPQCNQLYETTPAVIGPVMDFRTIPAIQSTTGTIDTNQLGLTFNPGSPVWLATFITLTNAINLVSFQSAFSGVVGSKGLFSVFWDTNVIGSIDERIVPPGLQQYRFAFPSASANSTHILAFRLDPFTTPASSVTITNVSMSFVGVSQPFSLTITTNTSDGLRVFQLNGQSGFNYRVEASSNLINWDTIAVLVNTNGTVRFTDQYSTNFNTRFYRAVTP